MFAESGRVRGIGGDCCRIVEDGGVIDWNLCSRGTNESVDFVDGDVHPVITSGGRARAGELDDIPSTKDGGEALQIFLKGLRFGG